MYEITNNMWKIPSQHKIKIQYEEKGDFPMPNKRTKENHKEEPKVHTSIIWLFPVSHQIKKIIRAVSLDWIKLKKETYLSFGNFNIYTSCNMTLVHEISFF